MLSAAQVQQYQGEGFVVVPNFVTADDLGGLTREITDIIGASTLATHDASRLEMEPGQSESGTRIRRVYEPCHDCDRFQHLAESSRLLDCLEQLVGPHILLHYSKINMKPAEIGSVVEWHQDLCYYPLTNSNAVTVLFYLDDATLANGCLQVLPGLHRGMPLDHTQNGYFQGRITESVNESQAVPLAASAGSAIFLHCLTPHASAPNTSGQERRTLIIGFRAADAFPVYRGPVTTRSEEYVRLVRGQASNKARFSLSEFPIPIEEHTSKSLYDLQARSRAGE